MRQACAIIACMLSCRLACPQAAATAKYNDDSKAKLSHTIVEIYHEALIINQLYQKIKSINCNFQLFLAIFVIESSTDFMDFMTVE